VAWNVEGFCVRHPFVNRCSSFQGLGVFVVRFLHCVTVSCHRLC